MNTRMTGGNRSKVSMLNEPDMLSDAELEKVVGGSKLTLGAILKAEVVTHVQNAVTAEVKSLFGA
ncbi:MAG TPA: hypothetical protein VH678_31280 [Xanthobacteraceae bacterium]|jgi:hypothetical protein